MMPKMKKTLKKNANTSQLKGGYSTIPDNNESLIRNNKSKRVTYLPCLTHVNRMTLEISNSVLDLNNKILTVEVESEEVRMTKTSRSKRSGKHIKFKDTSQTSGNNSLMGDSMSRAFNAVGAANQSVSSRASKSSLGSKKEVKKRTLPPKAVKRKAKTADMSNKQSDTADNRKRIRNFEDYRIKQQEYSAKSTERLPQLNQSQGTIQQFQKKNNLHEKLEREVKRINDDKTLSPRSKKKILSRIKGNFDTSSGASGIDKSIFNAIKNKISMFSKSDLIRIKNLGQGNCPYCLSTRVVVIELDCTHSFCSKCCMNLIKITKIKKGLNYFAKTGEEVIKCPKCHQINILGQDKATEIVEVREYEEQRLRQMEKTQEALKSKYQGPPCHLCPNSTEKPPMPAQFECLNCESTLLCYDCKVKHQRNPRYKEHKLVKYIPTFDISRAEEMKCPEHKEKYRLYCFTEEKPLCLSCNKNENSKHSTHYVKPLASVLEQAEKEKEQLKKDIIDEIDKVDAAIQYFSGIEDIFINQKNLYLKKLSADFEVIYKLVERKHAELKDKISSIYDQHLKEAYQYVEGLAAIKDTISSLNRMDIRIDIDQINLNKAIMYRLREIETELDFELQGQDMDLIESRFLFEPFYKIEKSLMQFDFYPIQNSQLRCLEKIFLEKNNSKILTRDLITTDFLMIMPQNMIRGELVYQYTSEQVAIQMEMNQYRSLQTVDEGKLGAKEPENLLPLTGPQRFHHKCDNRGPTLTIVKANDGYIFGGFNPTSWVSEFMYSECEDAYLFSITDGKGRKPIKCKARPEKKDKAIKQNEKNYSPAFGEANISDLFIAYKNLSNSYSMLGNVYKLPKGFKAETFLAGRHNDWKIDEIEVWAISYQ